MNSNWYSLKKKKKKNVFLRIVLVSRTKTSIQLSLSIKNRNGYQLEQMVIFFYNFPFFYIYTFGAAAISIHARSRGSYSIICEVFTDVQRRPGGHANSAIQCESEFTAVRLMVFSSHYHFLEKRLEVENGCENSEIFLVTFCFRNVIAGRRWIIHIYFFFQIVWSHYLSTTQLKQINHNGNH